MRAERAESRERAEREREGEDLVGVFGAGVQHTEFCPWGLAGDVVYVRLAQAAIPLPPKKRETQK